jgi:peptide deformylase
MDALPILIWPDARLTQTALPVMGLTEAIHDLARKMLRTMYAASGRGLAAPQVGVMQRVFVMDLTWKTDAGSPLVCINPVILWRSDVVAQMHEGCLSIPEQMIPVTRAQAIRLEWTDLTGARQIKRLAGMAAICAQHEIDHLDGILTFDHLPSGERNARRAQNI